MAANLVLVDKTFLMGLLKNNSPTPNPTPPPDPLLREIADVNSQLVTTVLDKNNTDQPHTKVAKIGSMISERNFHADNYNTGGLLSTPPKNNSPKTSDLEKNTDEGGLDSGNIFVKNILQSAPPEYKEQCEV